MKKLLLIISLLVSLSCMAQSHFIVDVSTFGEYDMNGKTYFILPADSNISPYDLEFKEYSVYMAKVLATVGAKETSNIADADICILMYYDITDQSYVETVSQPTYGKTGIRSITTNTFGYGATNTNANANVSAYNNSAYGTGNVNTTSNTNQTTTTNINYSYGVTGYKTIERDVDNYLRIINLYAYDNKVSNDAIMVWKANIMSDGSNNKLRQIVPAMSYSMTGCLGLNIEESYTIYEDNANYTLFKKFKIKGDNVYTVPTIENFSASELIKIIAIERRPNETIVTFYKNSELPNITISKKIALEYNGNTLLPIGADNIKLGKRYLYEKTMFFTIHFPPIPNDVDIINITEEGDTKIKKMQDRKYWKGIHLSNL